jgi:hypothetical protein
MTSLFSWGGMGFEAACLWRTRSQCCPVLALLRATQEGTILALEPCTSTVRPTSVLELCALRHYTASEAVLHFVVLLPCVVLHELLESSMQASQHSHAVQFAVRC